MLAHRRGLDAVRGANHRACQRLHRVERRRSRPQRLEHRQRLAVAEPHGLLLDPFRRLDGASAQAPLEEVDVLPREARVGRAEEGVEVAAAAAEPREPQDAEQRLPEWNPVEARVGLERIRDPERPERRLERRLPALERGADDPDLFRRHAGAQEREQLVADDLESTARPGSLEEAKGTADRRRIRIVIRRRLEQPPLEVRERGLGNLVEARRQLVDPAVGEAGEIVHRARERREDGAPGLVRDRDRYLGAPGECVEQRPLRSRQILEPVREDRLAGPGVELLRDTLRRPAADQVGVPELEPVELGAVRPVQGAELTLEVVRVEEPGFELPDDRQERVGEAAEPRRPPEAVERPPGERTADDEPALRLRGHGPGLATAPGEQAEDVVEGADGAGEERRLDLEEVALDTLDVRPVRHDQIRLPWKRLEIAAQQERHLPGVRRSGDEVQTQPTHFTRGLRRPPNGPPRELRRGFTRLPTSAVGHAARPLGRASCRRSRRRDRPASSRASRR